MCCLAGSTTTSSEPYEPYEPSYPAPLIALHGKHGCSKNYSIEVTIINALFKLYVTKKS
jgi:hypothetical protein